MTNYEKRIATCGRLRYLLGLFVRHILTNSRDIDSPEWTQKSYGIEIEDYVWVATKATVLPSCRHGDLEKYRETRKRKGCK